MFDQGAETAIGGMFLSILRDPAKHLGALGYQVPVNVYACIFEFHLNIW